MPPPKWGGGVPFCMLMDAPESCCLPAFIGANFRQKGAKMNFSLVVVGVFSGKSETRRRKVLIYFWCVGAGGAGCAGSLACPLVQRWAGLRGIRTCQRLALVLWWCVLCLSSALSLCLWCIVLEYALISRFKGIFSGFWAFRVGLCCSDVLRGLWGFVRVWS